MEPPRLVLPVATIILVCCCLNVASDTSRSDDNTKQGVAELQDRRLLYRQYRDHRRNSNTLNESRPGRGDQNIKPVGSINAAGYGSGSKEVWGYANIRPNAFLFWWLYYTTNPRGFRHRPLVIWIQGGPGASSTGFGNFQEIGPLTVDLKKRHSTWLKEASLLFIDNPVGAGFSYVTNDNAYTTNVTIIAEDLVKMMKHFLAKVPAIRAVPVYIFSESYGGKMTSAFSQALYQAIKVGAVKCDFRGFALGDSWISPIDSVLSYGQYLFGTSLVDEVGLKAVNDVANEAKKAVDAGKWLDATKLWGEAEEVIANCTNNVNLYNIINYTPSLDQQAHQSTKPGDSDLSRKALAVFEPSPLAKLMNGPIRKKLMIIPSSVTWGGQSDQVFTKLAVDFMKPVVDIVDDLLQKTDLKIVVYSGQLDLIVDTIGTERWIRRLTWPDLANYLKAPRLPMLSKSGRTSAFVKTYGNFSFYWILDSGHMVPADQPRTALKMLKRIIG